MESSQPRASLWQGGVAESLDEWYRLVGGGDPPPSTITVHEDGPFDGEFRRCVMDGFTVDVLDVMAPPHTVTRTTAHISEHGVAEHLVIFQFAGSSVFSQAGASVQLRPGDVGVGSSLLTYAWEFHEPARFMVLRIDRDRATVPFGRLMSRLARPVRARRGIVAHFSHLAQGIADEPSFLEGGGGQRIVEGLYAMCEGGFLSQGEEPAPPSARERVLAATRLRLREPGLRLTDISAASFLSPRQVQRIFEAEGTTFRVWVRDKRLDAVRRELRRPGGSELLGEIAARWGFPDAAHFARSFRARFGESPSAYRTRITSARGTSDVT